MTIEKKLLATNPVSGEVLPEAVSFDGTSDYLSRSSDLTGNSDGKTFTFSAWVYAASNNSTILWTTDGSNQGIKVNINNRVIAVSARSGGTTVLGTSVSTSQVVENTWYHVLWSIDLANSSNRYCYINDVAVSPSFGTYTNSNISFTKAAWQVSYRTGNFTQQRLAHLFLDYTYRDLSVTANRRLFITADGKPSSTIPSNPILYLPMKDAATAGSNSGTGGDFTVNGVLATAERGPNQDNCVASTFDGSNDYLSSSSSISLGNKTITFSCIINSADLDKGGVLQFSKNSDTRFFLYLDGHATSGEINIAATKTSSGNDLLHVASLGCYKVGQNVHIAFSCDMSDTSKRQLFINGVAKTNVQYGQYFNDNFATDINTATVGKLGSTNFKGSAGEVYLNNTYTDLATDNPFWDSDANRPNSVRKVIEDTGVTPLIALPIIGNDAGNNLGSGGDFTVNSGPYTGARGGSEFFARSASKASDSGNYLSRGPIVSSSTTTYSGVVFAKGTPSLNQLGYIATIGGRFELSTVYNDVSKIRLSCASTGSSVNQVVDNFDPSVWNAIFFGIDTNANIYLRVRNVESTASATAGGTINLQNQDMFIMSYYQGATTYGFNNVGFLYFDDSYIDFSQEANRNKFVDQLGYPKDLTKQIDDGDIPNPLVYMKFDPSVSLGTNSGTGGNFTVNGTVTAGADVTP